MKALKILFASVLSLPVLGYCWLCQPLPVKLTSGPVPIQPAAASFANVEIDSLGTGIISPTPGVFQKTFQSVTWPEDRWLIGWSPWVGFGGGTVCESHLILEVGGAATFLRGPHKEAGGRMYDITGSDFFPAGTGRFVPAGTAVTIEFLVLNTGDINAPRGGQANARIFSVKAQ